MTEAHNRLTVGTGAPWEDRAEAQHQPQRKDLLRKRVRGQSSRSSNGDVKANFILRSILGKRRFEITHLPNSLISQLAVGI